MRFHAEKRPQFSLRASIKSEPTIDLCMKKWGVKTTLIDPTLENVGGQLTPLTLCFRAKVLWFTQLPSHTTATHSIPCSHNFSKQGLQQILLQITFELQYQEVANQQLPSTIYNNEHKTRTFLATRAMSPSIQPQPTSTKPSGRLSCTFHEV